MIDSPQPPTESPAPVVAAPIRKARTRAPLKTYTPWERIKEHKVLQWTLAYAAAAYTLLHVVEMFSGAFGWPHVIVRVLSLLLILGVPVTVLLAWYHGHKAQHRISGPELAMLTVLLFIAGTLLWAFSGTRAEHTDTTATTGTTSAESAIDKSTAPVAPRTAVAVLPFANLTGDASKDYLGDGMAEELINTLTKVQGLKVPARTSTFAYKGRNTDVRQIAKDLGVGTVLEGSVRAAGKRIRITAQLINAQDGLHLWSETYDEEFTDIFKLQDKLATQIATALQPSLSGAVQAVVAQGPPTQDVEAYNLYLQAWMLAGRSGESIQKQALAYFQKAVDRDPKFAAAYAGIARTEWTLSNFVQPAEHVATAERAARQALALDPTIARAHGVLADVAARRGRLLEMEVHSRQALALGANDSLIHAIRSGHMRVTGYLHAAQEEAQKAYALSPADPNPVAIAAVGNWLIGRDAEARRLTELAITLGRQKDPLISGYDALRGRRYSEAADIFGGPYANPNQGPEAAHTTEVIRMVFAALADPARRNAALEARTRLYPKPPAGTDRNTLSDATPCLVSSLNYGLLGALDVAYDLANQCLDQSVPGHTLTGSWGHRSWTHLWTPEMRPFRRDPRFQALATRLGLMEYWQQYGPPDLCNLKDGKLTCH
jgi:TolB-like protein/Flp pilus assembly protein TadD